MKKLILISAFTLLTASVSSAQDYKWAIGGHFSVESGGVSVKHKFNTQNALEVLLLKPEWDDGCIVNVLYQRHVPVISHGFNF